VAVDLKADPARYTSFALRAELDRAVDFSAAVSRTCALLRDSRIEGEYRSLVFFDDYFSVRDIAALASLTIGYPWFFSAFRGGNCLDESWNEIASPTSEQVDRLVLEAIKKGAEAHRR
jgi:hypothetical protein